MIAWLRRHRKAIFVLTIGFFMIGIFVGLGGYYFSGCDEGDAIAVVGKTRIPYLRYKVRVNQYLDAMRQENKEVGDELAKRVHREILMDMVVDEILAEQASLMGVRVTDLELSSTIRNTPRFQRGGAFDQLLYFQIVRHVMRTTPEDYEAQQRKAMRSFKLKQLIFNRVKLTPAELLREYVRAKGSDKGFEKERDAFAQGLHQARAIDLINFYLRTLRGTMEVRDYLQKFEPGL